VAAKRYRSVLSLQRDCLRCRACAEAGYPLESLSVFEGRPGQRAYMFGQAPGIVEGAERRPWRGRAGQTLRRWLELDEAEFYATFYCASVTRCYPGRATRGDRTPTTTEQEGLRLLRPRLIVTVGGLAARWLLGQKSLECIGSRFERDGAIAIPLPHPSGASGWLNAPANRLRLEQALALVREELQRATA